jgi:DNA-binding GntR family transcriptional regulator
MTAPPRSAYRFDEDFEVGIGRNKMTGPTGKAGQIVAIMEQRLIHGYYSPGEMLSFSMLAEEFNVSRQPVGAAIAHLRMAGYVEVMPQVGCQIVVSSESEVLDFFLMLGKIESATAALAAKRHKDREVEGLLAIQPPRDLSELSGHQAQRQAYIHSVDEYHNQIWKMARAPLLEAKFSGLRRLAHFYLWQGIGTLTTEAAKKLSAERREIARAIKARDADEAARLMEAHIIGKPVSVGFNAEQLQEKSRDGGKRSAGRTSN